MAKISVLIAFLPYFLCAMTQRQTSPCPEYFTYMTKPGIFDMLGQIEIPSPSENDTFFLKVALDTTTEWPSQVLRLELAQSIKASVGRVHRGKSLLYHIYYSVHEPIPSISAIWFNNRRYCPGPAVSGNITANVELGHILYPPNEVPLMYSDGLWQQISQLWHRNFSIYRVDNPSYDRLNNDECGVTSYYTDDTNRLISDFEETLPGQWPWLVAIYESYSNGSKLYKRSGFILTSRHIITVWQHGLPDDIDKLYVSFGQLKSRRWHENHTGVVHRGVADHKTFSGNFGQLVILILKTAVEYNAFIRPICLWSGSTNLQDIVNMTGYIAGWGYDFFKDPLKNIMNTSDLYGDFNIYEGEPRTVKMPLRNIYYKKYYENSWNETLKYLVVQTGHLWVFNIPCDIGGGLVVSNIITGRYQLRGVALFCGAISSVYIDVTPHLAWIREQINII